MSALGGIYNFDGAPVDERLLEAIGDRLDKRGPDGGSNYVSDSVGMAYRAFRTTSESRMEIQPLISGDGNILCWDGRLDNRENLISVLRDDLQGDYTDAGIVMASYVKWGVDFLSRIIGDFALSLWNPRDGTLLLARDPIGPRMLYYHRNDKRIIWVTDLESLLDLAGIDLEINEEYVADVLAGFPELGRTPYKHMHGVPPAHAVIARNGQIKVQRFWGLDPEHKIRYKTDAEYEEHFRHLFREAVRCRLRADGPVWAELSGGLDSSSVVCIADDLIKSGEAQSSCLETVSRVYDEASKSDERRYIQYVEEKIGKKGLYLREDDYRFISPFAERYSRTFPNLVADFVAEYYKAINDAMQEGGARVLLSGEGGDEVACAIKDPYPELTDLLLQGKLLTLHRRLRVWSETLKKSYFNLLWREAIIRALPLPQGYLEARSRAVKAMNRIYDRQFLKKNNLNARRFGLRDVFGFQSHSGRFQSNLFLRAVRLLSAGYHRELTNVEFRYPYAHRPLVEFLQAIPFEQKVRPSETRSIVRRALNGLLPSEVTNRKGKSMTFHAYLRALVRESERLNRLFSEPRVCAYGYANYQFLQELLETARKGELSRCSLGLLIPIEYWLQAFESRRASLYANPEPVAEMTHKSMVIASGEGQG